MMRWMALISSSRNGFEKRRSRRIIIRVGLGLRRDSLATRLTVKKFSQRVRGVQRQAGGRMVAGSAAARKRGRVFRGASAAAREWGRIFLGGFAASRESYRIFRGDSATARGWSGISRGAFALAREQGEISGGVFAASRRSPGKYRDILSHFRHLCGKTGAIVSTNSADNSKIRNGTRTSSDFQRLCWSSSW